jgi:hypothetical protein
MRAPKRAISRAKSNHQRGKRCLKTIISSVATNRPAVMPPLVVRTTCPLWL